MKSLKILSLVAVTAMLLIIVACNNPGKASIKNSSKDTIPDQGFALLELFTSEGCSSCPPADRLLARIQEEAGNRPIYLLSEHVDYWDHLGWKDIFSQREFSERQYRYDNLLKAQVYTPQLIVNGKKEYLGSDEAAVSKAVRSAVETKTKGTLNLKATPQGKEMEISYDVTGNSPADKLLIAVVQKHAVRKIGDGENRGRTLNHAQIVRSLFSFSIPTANKGTEQIALPADYKRGDYEIIGFLQDEKTGEIANAVRAG
jgi:hypothetical protein